MQGKIPAIRLQPAQAAPGFEDTNVSDAVHFPATRRELLDMLQVRLTAYEDSIEVNAIFTVEPIKR